MVIQRIKKIVDEANDKFYGRIDNTLAIQMSAIVGLLFGLSAICYKIAASSQPFTIYTIFTPIFIVGGIMSLVAGLLLQISLKHGRTSVVFIITTALGAIIPLVGGLMMGEILKTMEMAGIVFLIVGMIVVVKDYKG